MIARMLWSSALAAVLITVGGEAPARSSAHGAPARAQVGVPELEHLLTGGCAECSGPAQLGEVRSLGVDAAGRMYVLSTFAPFVRIFGADGDVVGTAGPDGDGPGELRRPSWIHVGDGGEFLAHGSRLNRIVRFDGANADTYTVSTRSISDAAYDGTRGLLYLAAYEPTGGPASILRWQPGGELAVVAEGEAPTGTQRVTPIFSLAVARDGGFASGDGDAYRIRRYEADGRFRATFGRDLEIARKSAEEIAEERRIIEQRGLPVPRIAETKPHFGIAALAFDDADRLWVRTTRGGFHDTVFDLFGADGDYLGEAVMPGRAAERHFVVRDGKLTATVLDDIDNPFVTVWRIR